ncbi:hypothetical protein COV17_01990 [Candidatus Woesearchaeota archaeon CG10_big_fil_rev_8_21_14_0_10_36_11]|nr:MAG: hypothetical protein COV17_01990 [Candidatus Woesearchaeota archaeon CG10_big_fil_rev_8_21_14_0_10_36_11]
MAIREAQKQDYEQLVELLKSFFSTHNIFQKEKKDIITYITTQKETVLVNDQENKIVGTVFLVVEKDEGTHTRWKFRHFAFNDKDNGKELLTEAERRVRAHSDTAKVELTIAENEKSMNFLKEQGYKEEGALHNHYRWGETCFVVGKSFS